MPKINKYQDISEIDREAKKDLIDRHSPFIHCAETAKAGEPFQVTVKMGNEYTHPDDFDHFIESVTLFNGETKLAQATYVPGTLGNVKAHNTTTFTLKWCQALLQFTSNPAGHRASSVLPTRPLDATEERRRQS
jgi:superoxide reductase